MNLACIAITNYFTIVDYKLWIKHTQEWVTPSMSLRHLVDISVIGWRDVGPRDTWGAKEGMSGDWRLKVDFFLPPNPVHWKCFSVISINSHKSDRMSFDNRIKFVLVNPICHFSSPEQKATFLYMYVPIGWTEINESMCEGVYS